MFGSSAFSQSTYADDGVVDVTVSLTNKYFSVAAQETSPQNLSFKSDGTKMYVLGATGDDVNEYDLSTAWDVTTASYLQSFSIAAQETSPVGLSFKSDGTKMYVLGYAGDDVNEYDLSTAWDVSTASYLQSFSVAAQETTPTGLTFRPDGTKMYVLGLVGQDVNEYNLSTAWDVSTASYLQRFSVAAQETNCWAISFRPDGTKMYVSGSAGDDVNEYDLSTAWDVSTASYSQNFSVQSQDYAPQGLFFKPDGTSMYISGGGYDRVYEYVLGTAWDISTAYWFELPVLTGAVGSATTTGDAVVPTTGLAATGAVGSVTVSADAVVPTTGLAATGSVGSVTVAADAVVSVTGVSSTGAVGSVTASSSVTVSLSQFFSVAAQETGPHGLFFKPDGLRMYVSGSIGDKVYEYVLGTAWVVSTASYLRNKSILSQDTSSRSVFFKPDGTKMYVLGRANASVFEYDLGTAWDVTTASYLQSFSIYSEEWSPTAVSFKSDGSKMYIIGDASREVHEYDLSTSWDVTTASYLQAYSVSSQDTKPEGLFFRPDGTKMYVSGDQDNDINEYDLSTAWDVTTASYVQNFSVQSQTQFPYNLFFETHGSKMYIVVGVTNGVYEYDLGTNWDISTATYPPLPASAPAGVVGSVTATGGAVVPTTGLEATSAVGSVTVTGTAVVSPTGVSSTGGVGSPTVTGDAVVPTTGLEATGNVGSVTVAASAVVSPTGVSSTGEVGSVTVAADAVVTVTGVSSTGEVGSPTVTGDAVVPTTGLEATGNVGSVTVSADAVVAVTGVSSTGEVGSVTVSADAVVAVTGVSSTGEVGSPTVTGDAVVPTTGLEATSAVGSVTVSAGADVAVTGVSSTGAVGSVTVTGTAVVSPTGVSSTGEVGSPTVTGDAVVPTTGLEATSAVGSVTVAADAVVAVTGVSSTGEVGSVTVTGTAVVSLTGVSSTGEVGSVTAKASATVSVAGVSAEGLVGQVLVWSRIVPDPGTEYTDITPEATSTWTDLEPSAITSWTKIAA